MDMRRRGRPIAVAVVSVLVILAAGRMAAAEDVTMQINVASKTGLVFYSGSSGVLEEGAVYDVYLGRAKLGEVRIRRAAETFTQADVVSGDFTRYEDSVVSLRPTGETGAGEPELLPSQTPLTPEDAGVRMRLDLVVDSRAMFYRGKDIGLTAGTAYDVSADGKIAGRLKVANIGDTFTTADIESGDLKGLEGMTVTLMPAAEGEPTVTAKKEKAEKSETKAEKKSEKKESKSEKKRSKTEKKETTAKKTPEKKKETTTAKKTSAPAKKESGAEKNETAAEVEVETPTRPEREQSLPTPTGRHQAVTTTILQLEVHTDDSNDTSPNEDLLGLVSSTRRVKRSLQTIYAMYLANFPADATADVYGVGYIHTYFFDPLTFGTIGIGYMGREHSAMDETGSLSFGINWLRGVRKDRDYYYRYSANYATNADFDRQKTLTLAGAYYHNYHNDQKLSFEYRYVYSYDQGNQAYNKYTLDYTWPVGHREKLKLAYIYTDNTYARNGFFRGAADSDQAFRLSWYLTH